ncbi:MAG TPA: acetate--CoA ligase family protein, partial [Nevskiaceae bacterium]|nr:acetate--CoA ligase family protein [Nevskiaceae bacterium]
MARQDHPLAGLFEPRSIALVGATEKSMWTRITLGNFKAYGYQGELHLVNRKGDPVFGRPAFASCKAIGKPVDAAFIMVAQEVIFDALDDVAAAGVRSAVILTSGFAETGPEGAALQDRLVAHAEKLGIRFVGPNCLGLVNVAARAPLTAIPPYLPLQDGVVSLVSQSGATMADITKFAHVQGVGLRVVCATGNEAHTSIADIVDYLVDDPGTKVIGVFAEAIRKPELFLSAARRAHAAAKPIVILKIGRSPLTAAVAQAHTGSLVGDDRVFDAICTANGLCRVHSLEDLVTTCSLIAQTGPLKKTGLGVISISGGGCTLFSDNAEAAGLALPAFAPETVEALRGVLPSYGSTYNPLDVTGGAVTDPTIFERALTAVSADPAVGLSVCLFELADAPERKAFVLGALKHIGVGLRKSQTPGVLVTQTCTNLSATSLEMKAEAGLPATLSGNDHAVRALAHLVRWSESLQTTRAAPPAPKPWTGARPQSEREVLDLLSGYGVPVIPSRIVRSVDEAADAARDFGEPVALKIASPDIAHKTEVGGVRLNVSGEGVVRDAFAAIEANVRSAKPTARLEGQLIAPMRTGGTELIVGVARDPQWGLVLALGLGGVWVEVLQDSALRPLPVTPADVRAMLGELKASKLLQGYRGSKPANLERLAAAVTGIANAAIALGPDLASLEVNPLYVDGDRVEALDGLIL